MVFFLQILDPVFYHFFIIWNIKNLIRIRSDQSVKFSIEVTSTAARKQDKKNNFVWLSFQDSFKDVCEFLEMDKAVTFCDSKNSFFKPKLILNCNHSSLEVQFRGTFFQTNFIMIFEANW